MTMLNGGQRLTGTDVRSNQQGSSGGVELIQQRDDEFRWTSGDGVMKSGGNESDGKKNLKRRQELIQEYTYNTYLWNIQSKVEEHQDAEMTSEENPLICIGYWIWRRGEKCVPN